MKTKVSVAAILCAVVILVGSANVMAENDISEEDRGIQLQIDGVPASLSSDPVLLYADIEDGLYVPMLSFCQAMGAEDVVWDAASESAVCTFSDYSIDASAENTYIQANGRYLYVKFGLHAAKEDVLAPLSVLVQAFNAGYQYDEETRQISVTTGSGRMESGADYYSREDVYWLARIIYAEVGNESFASKVAVGNVVMNRVASSGFPNTVKSVIFDTAGGVQFDPADNGSIYNTPGEDCYIAAKLALDGAKPVGDCLFFAAVRGCWATHNRAYYTTIGCTDFYL